MFGITYSAVSHNVRQVKGRKKTDRNFQRDYVWYAQFTNQDVALFHFAHKGLSPHIRRAQPC